MPKKLHRNLLLYVALAAALVWIVATVAPTGSEPEELRFDEFFGLVEAGRIDSATIYLRDQKIEGEMTDETPFKVHFAGEGEGVADRLAESEVETEVKPQEPGFLQQLLMNWFPLLLIFGLIIFMLYRAQGGGSGMMSFGKSRAKQVTKEMPKITFDEVAGADEAVEEIREIKDFLQDPEKFQAMGAKIPKGVLLFGPPGTGKTLLARAVAGEAGVPFYTISGSDFVEMFVGVGAARVRDLFEQAKQNAPAIVFVDEIDAVGRQRGAGLGGGHDEREQTLNQMLVEMDGFDVRTGVVLIAATNRPDILDPALLRPGRFDRHITIDRPDLKGRHDVLKVHAKHKPMAPDVDLEVVARRTPGFTGADLENVVNEAALLSARRESSEVSNRDLEEAIDRVMAGPERKSRLITADERRIIAYHEGGHALVAHLCPHAHPVHKISIIPRGRALGFTLTLPTEDRYLVTKAELVDELAVMLGGRAAEELVFGDVTTGAQDDIDRSTKIARQMVCEYGMSALGPMALGQKSETPFLGRDVATRGEHSDRVAAEIDTEIRGLIEAAFERAKTLLDDNRELLDTLAGRLIDDETLEASVIEEIFARVPAAKARRGELLEKGSESQDGSKEGSAEKRRRLRPRPGFSPA